MLWLSYLPLLGTPLNKANRNLKQIVLKNIFPNEIWTMQKNMAVKYFQIYSLQFDIARFTAFRFNNSIKKQ